MKVLMVETFYPGNTYTDELSRKLGKDVDLTVVSKHAPAVQKTAQWKDILYKGGSRNKIAAAVKYFVGTVRLFAYVRFGKYDVVHVQNFFKEAVEIPLYLRLLPKRTRLVHTVHNILPHEAQKSQRRRFRKFYEACDALIVHNETCREQLIRQFGIKEEKIVVVPHGTYTVEHREKPRSGKTKFVQFGVIRKYKGVETVLRAIASIPIQDRQNIEVTIAGKQFTDMDDTDYFSLIRSFGIGDCVKFIPDFLQEDELNELIEDSDICLFPYKNIYTSGALLMAYAHEKPVIASDLSVFREETDNGSTGVLFPPGNSAELSRVIYNAQQWPDILYAEYRKNIRQLVEEKYNWERSAEMLRETYERVCVEP